MENSGLPMETQKSARMAAICSTVRLGRQRALGTTAELKLKTRTPVLRRRPHLLGELSQSPDFQLRNSPLVDLFRRSYSGDLQQQPRLPIKLDQRRGAAVVSLEPNLNRLRPVVFALKQPALATIATRFDFRTALRGPSLSRNCFSETACAAVRGNPSRMNPPAQCRHTPRSWTKSQTVVSGTSSPRRMYPRASFMAGLSSPSIRVAAARKTSPVDRWQASSCWFRRSAWVPLPTPGAPSRTILQGKNCPFGTVSHRPEGPCSQAARVGLFGTVMG